MGLAKVLGALSTIGLATVISRTYGVSAYGEFAVALTLANLLALVGGWGGAQTYISRRTDGADDNELYAFLLFSAWWPAILLPLAFLLTMVFDLGTAIAVVLAFIPLSMLANKAGILIFDGRQIWNSILDDILRPTLPLIVVGIASSISFASATVRTATWKDILLPGGLYFLGLCVVTGLSLRGLFPGFRWTKAVRNFYWSGQVPYVRAGLPLMLAGTLVLCLAQADRFMLKQMIPLEALGVYVLAQTAVNLFSYASQSVVNTVLPTLVAATRLNDVARARSTCRRYSLLLLSIGACALAGSATIGRTYFGLFDVPSGLITEGVRCLLILIAGQTVASVFGFGVTMGNYVDNKSPLLAALGCSVAVTLGGCLLLVPSLGAVGAAVATAFGTVLSKFLMWMYFRKRGLPVGVM